MFIGLAIQDALGMAFGLVVIVLSFWFVYTWAIKPERDRRRQDALHALEEMHRNRRDNRARWVRLETRESEKPIESRKYKVTADRTEQKPKGIVRLSDEGSD